jgi:hypothetical protein
MLFVKIKSIFNGKNYLEYINYWYRLLNSINIILFNVHSNKKIILKNYFNFSINI